MTEATISFERVCAVWFGALLLERGHVVHLPNGRPELHLRTARGIKKVLLSLRDTPVDRSRPRTVVGRIHDLEGPDAPHVIVIMGWADRTIEPLAVVPVGIMGLADRTIETLAVVPVGRTRASWLADGIDYTLATDELVSYDELHGWLAKLGPP